MVTAASQDLTLGCAEEYTVIITARDLATYAAEVRWSSISWSRVLDEVSTATVVVPDVFGGLRCNIELGDAIVPWRFGIRIERNGSEVWSGPITSITRPTRDGAGADYVEIMASDIMIWMAKRTTTASQLYTDQDGGTVFKGVLEDATQFDNLFDLQCPEFTTGYLMTREILALDFEYTLDVLSELANSAVDYFVYGKELVVYDVADAGWFVQRDGVKTRIAPTTDPFGRYIYGLFTDESYIARPGFTIDGMGQANNVYIPGADSGEAGFRRYWEASDVNLLDGLLTMVDVNPLYRPQEGLPITADGVFQQRADSMLALRSTAPVIFSGGALSPSAPVTIDGLLPGSLWAIDLAEVGVGRLLDAQRLKQIDVSVSVSAGGIVEQVSPTLMPIGTDESQSV
jgi:hypothetical protein